MKMKFFIIKISLLKPYWKRSSWRIN